MLDQLPSFRGTKYAEKIGKQETIYNHILTFEYGLSNPTVSIYEAIITINKSDTELLASEVEDVFDASVACIIQSSIKFKTLYMIKDITYPTISLPMLSELIVDVNERSVSIVFPTLKISIAIK